MLFVGIDIGGTFTDLALYDSERNEVHTHKVRSTPDEPDRALMAGVGELCERLEVEPGEIAGILHGTTVATNAVLQHVGAETGLLTTEGMRDIVHIGRHQRPQPYSVMQDIPWQSRPFVRRARRLTVPERLSPPRGETIVPLDEEAVRAAARELREAGVESVAVCFLFSYLNPAHEQRAAAILAEEEPAWFVTTSADVSPQFREFERFTTTCMNAFVGPGTGRYLERLGAALGGLGVSAELLVMRSNGGLASVEEAAARPVTLMLSGPAAGVLGAQWAGGLAERDRLITFDMGGTSADIGLVTDGRPHEASARDTQIAGYPVLVPMFDLQTIGAGGGSIARLDAGGAFQVGPHSAGADPGPACYGLGGSEPTVTDAHLVLGRISADHFLGGDMQLDAEAAARAIGGLADELGMSNLETAEGILTVANANMAQTIRSITIERGKDPRDFTLVAFGGAGPLHAAEVAALLGVPEVLVPPHPGITSATGLLTSRLRYDLSQTVCLTEEAIDEEWLNGELDQLAEQLERRVLADSAAGETVAVERSLDCRYVGQGYELRVPVGPGGFELATLGAFHAAHEAEYGRRATDPVEVVNLRVTATGSESRMQRPAYAGRAEAAEIGEASAGWRRHGQLVELPTRYLWREAIAVGELVEGPAILFQRDTTIAVPPGWRARVATGGALLLSSREEGGNDA